MPFLYHETDWKGSNLGKYFASLIFVMEHLYPMLNCWGSQAFIKWKCVNSQLVFKMRCFLGWKHPCCSNTFHPSLTSPLKDVMVSWHLLYNFSIWFVILMSGIMYIQSICVLILKDSVLELAEDCRKSPNIFYFKVDQFFYHLCLYVIKIYAVYSWADGKQLLLIEMRSYCIFQYSFIAFWHLHCRI